MKRLAILLLGLLGMASAEASVTYGNDPNSPGTIPGGDGWSNFLVLETSTHATGSGRATGWEVYGAQAGTVASVILKPTGPGPVLPEGFNGQAELTTQYYEVTGVSKQTISQGNNSFSWTPTFGTADVKPESVFGLWIGTGKVGLSLGDPGSKPVIGYFDTYQQPGLTSLYDIAPTTPGLPAALSSMGCPTPTDCPQGGNGMFDNGPPALGTSYLVTYENPRIYSSRVTVVPIPAAIWLFGSAMAGGLAFSRRKG